MALEAQLAIVRATSAKAAVRIAEARRMKADADALAIDLMLALEALAAKSRTGGRVI